MSLRTEFMKSEKEYRFYWSYENEKVKGRKIPPALLHISGKNLKR